MEYDVIIVGASVAGSRTAELIAENGYKVLLIEEHEKVGYPNKCTGLVSSNFFKFLSDFPNKLIVNVINKAKFFSPHRKYFVLKSKNPAYVINRPGLDEFLFQKARKNKVSVKLSEKFEDFEYTDSGIDVKTNKDNYQTKLLIGADGANSLVANIAELKMPNKYFTGIQATVEGEFDQDSVELWFGSNISPKFFAWSVPESKTKARMGLATKSDVNNYYQKFLKERINEIKKPDTAGIIRIGLMEETIAYRVMLVGDAACQVKPFSGGGIIYGLKAAEICAQAAVKALKKNEFNYLFLKKEYDEKWKKVLEKPIKRGLRMRNFMDKLSDKQTDLFFLFLNKSKLTKFMERWDMDLF